MVLVGATSSEGHFNVKRYSHLNIHNASFFYGDAAKAFVCQNFHL